jgi:hypothetical protein
MNIFHYKHGSLIVRYQVLQCKYLQSHIILQLLSGTRWVSETVIFSQKFKRVTTRKQNWPILIALPSSLSEVLSCFKTNFHQDEKWELPGNLHNRDVLHRFNVIHVVSLTNLDTHTHTHTQTHMHKHARTHPCTHAHTHAQTHTHMHTHMHTHTHMHAHTHTHTHFLSFLLKLQPLKITKL